MKEKILKPAENNYEKNVIEYYQIDTDLIIYTTSCRNQYGSLWANKDIILSNKLPDNMIHEEFIRWTDDNWMTNYLYGKYTCNKDSLKSKLRKILLTDMPD